MKFSDTPEFFDSLLVNALFVIILIVLMFVVHECIHGIFFKLFSPKNKVYFGAANGMIYCAIPGDVYTVYVLISSIAPFVIITMLFIVTLFLGGFHGALFLLCHISCRMLRW